MKDEASYLAGVARVRHGEAKYGAKLGGAKLKLPKVEEIVRHNLTKNNYRKIILDDRSEERLMKTPREIDPIFDYDFRGILNEINRQTCRDVGNKKEVMTGAYYKLSKEGLTNFKRENREAAEWATSSLFIDSFFLFELDEEKRKKVCKGAWLIQRNWLRKWVDMIPERQLFLDKYQYLVYDKYALLSAFRDPLYPKLLIAKPYKKSALESEERWELVKAVVYVAYVKKGMEIALKLDKRYEDIAKRSYNYFFLLCTLYSLYWLQDEMVKQGRAPFLKNEKDVCIAFGISPKQFRRLMEEAVCADLYYDVDTDYNVKRITYRKS